MLCQKCGAVEARFHYNSNINGEFTELHLCSDCAAELESQSPFKLPIQNDFNSLLSTFLNSLQRNAVDTAVCPLCGLSARELSNSAKVGCANCYDIFSDMLAPYIKRIHANSSHRGKIPAAAGPEIIRKQELLSLKSQLSHAVSIQDFESAAVLRDKIRDLEGGR